MQMRTIPFERCLGFENRFKKWRHRDRSKLATTSGGNACGQCVQYACVDMYRTSSVVIFMNGHFLRPTTSAKSISWVSTIVLGEKNLAPLKVGQTENFQTCLMDYHAFLLDHRTSCTVFRAIVVFAMTIMARSFTTHLTSFVVHRVRFGPDSRESGPNPGTGLT